MIRLHNSFGPLFGENDQHCRIERMMLAYYQSAPFPVEPTAADLLAWRQTLSVSKQALYEPWAKPKTGTTSSGWAMSPSRRFWRYTTTNGASLADLIRHRGNLTNSG